MTAVSVMLLSAARADAQWASQTISLDAGWNSVFVEIDPLPSDANALFAGAPIESVWWRASTRAPTPPRLDPACKAANPPPDCPRPDPACQGSNPAPDCPANPDTRWRVWLPPGPASNDVTSLRVITGGRVYLIKATSATDLTLYGPPSTFTERWRPGFNVAGMYVDDDGPTPTFDEYFAPAPGLVGASIFAMQPDGTLAAVAGETAITFGRGYWVSANAEFGYSGPINIDDSTLGGIDFGTRRLSHDITLVNEAGDPRDITATALPSVDPPDPQLQPTVAGDVPLYWLDFGGAPPGGEPQTPDDMAQWDVLASHTLTAVPADGSNVADAVFRVGVRRAGLAPAFLDTNLQGEAYQSLLEITDDHGFRRLLRVRAEALPTSGSPSIAGAMARPGLYLGTVTVNRVAWLTAGAQVWMNEDPIDPEFAGRRKCFGGDNDAATCQPDRKRCMGTPEIELMSIECDTNEDCPTGGTCEVITDCPQGACNPFCIGGVNDGMPCNGSAACEDPEEGGDDGVCSADIDASALRPTPAEFEFPVIIHLSDDTHLSQYKMLTEVTLYATEDEELVLGTPECDPELCDDLQGALTVNGARFAKRVSTAAFSFDGDLLLNGDFSASLAGQTTLAYNDPLNPFMHTFHPDHDCVDPDGDPQPGECFEITRSFVFAFEDDPPDGESVLDWGDSVLGGVYTEQVAGLHNETITAQGRFRLTRVSDLPALNEPVGKGGVQ